MRSRPPGAPRQGRSMTVLAVLPMSRCWTSSETYPRRLRPGIDWRAFCVCLPVVGLPRARDEVVPGLCPDCARSRGPDRRLRLSWRGPGGCRALVAASSQPNLVDRRWRRGLPPPIAAVSIFAFGSWLEIWHETYPGSLGLLDLWSPWVAGRLPGLNGVRVSLRGAGFGSGLGSHQGAARRKRSTACFSVGSCVLSVPLNKTRNGSHLLNLRSCRRAVSVACDPVRLPGFRCGRPARSWAPRGRLAPCDPGAGGASVAKGSLAWPQRSTPARQLASPG